MVVDHDGSFAWSTDWADWLKAANALPQALIDRWALLIFDIKQPNPFIPQTLRDAIRNSNLSKVPCVFSVGNLAEARATFDADFINSLNDLETIDVSFKANPFEFTQWASQFNLDRGWYADGINKVGIGGSQKKIDANLAAAINLRDSNGGIGGVYSWTYEKSAHIKEKILMGCDGLVVNTGGRMSGRGDDRYYSWADNYQKIMDNNQVSQVARLAMPSDFVK